jgi:3alpha(or 20beta)-hydroxysteroid dehydrogenase
MTLREGGGDMGKRLDGRVVIITGGARGMGAEEAELFRSEGAQVLIADIDEDGGRRVADRLGEGVAFQRLDVGDPAGWEAVVQTALDRFGKLDALVNNAGVYRRASLQETTPEIYEHHHRVNQLGVFLGLQAAMGPMRDGGGGAIVNVSSISGIRAFPDQAAYAMTKWAVRGLTKNAAVDLAPWGIRVNSLHPGFTDTEMIQENTPELNQAAIDGAPLRRAGQVGELARAALYLVSDESSFMTGSELVCDGGLTL